MVAKCTIISYMKKYLSEKNYINFNKQKKGSLIAALCKIY